MTELTVLGMGCAIDMCWQPTWQGNVAASARDDLAKLVEDRLTKPTTNSVGWHADPWEPV